MQGKAVAGLCGRLGTFVDIEIMCEFIEWIIQEKITIEMFSNILFSLAAFSLTVITENGLTDF